MVFLYSDAQERVDIAKPQLLREGRILKQMSASEGFSDLLWMGREGDYNVMVSKLLGPSLADLHEYCHSRFNLKTTLLIFD